MRIIFTITIIITILISGCPRRPPEDISKVVSKLVAACIEEPTHDQNCQQIPLDADLNSQVGSVEIINEETAKVEWMWKWGINRTEKYELTAQIHESGWHLTEIVKSESMKREREIIEIEPQIQQRFDQDLLREASYVVQVGSNGKRLIIKEISEANKKQETKIVLSTITADPTDWIVVKGTLAEREIKGHVTRLVRDYFMNYQAGDFKALEQLAPDAAKYDYQAALYITDFKVTLPEEIKIINSKNQDPKRAEINQSPIVEPFTLQASVPIQVSYSLFGLEFTSNDNLILSWSVDDAPRWRGERWTMPFWGVTKAVSLRQSVTLNGNTITLDGVATTHDSTLIALTVSQNQPTTVAIKGYQQTDELINFTQFPRAYKWIKQLPEQEELTITLSSGNLTAKANSAELNVNLSHQSALPVTSASGVQGRVEWGPTCGNVPETGESNACGNIPVETKLTITDPSGLVVAEGKSTKDGFYRIGLPPGEYVLIPESSALRHDPVKFTVQAGQLTYILIIYPSMIP